MYSVFTTNIYRWKGKIIISNILGFLYNVFRLWPLDQVSGWQATQEWVSYLSAGVSFTKINTRYAVSSQGLLVIVTSLSKNERASIISSRTIWVARFSFQLSKILASSPNTKMENYRLITDNVHGHIKVKHSATCHELLHVGIKTISC